MDADSSTLGRVGSVHETYAFGANEQAAGVAWKEVEAQCENVSCWRFCKPDRSAWFVTVMGERPECVEQGAEIAKSHGGTPSDEVVRTGMVDALRERRLKTAVVAAAQGKRDVRDVIHYGQSGAFLYPDGTMRPAKEGQG